MAGRKPKPIALKRLEGTYREDRDGERAIAETAIHTVPSVLFEKGVKVRVPKTIHTKYVKAYWRRLTGMLIDLQVLSPSDLPQVEAMCIVLEKLREVQVVWDSATPLDEGYDKIARLYITLSNKFDTLAAKYYVSPDARIKLKMDSLSAMKVEQEVIKGSDAIGALLAGRQ